MARLIISALLPFPVRTAFDPMSIRELVLPYRMLLKLTVEFAPLQKAAGYICTSRTGCIHT